MHFQHRYLNISFQKVICKTKYLLEKKKFKKWQLDDLDMVRILCLNLCIEIVPPSDQEINTIVLNCLLLDRHQLYQPIYFQICTLSSLWVVSSVVKFRSYWPTAATWASVLLHLVSPATFWLVFVWHSWLSFSTHIDTIQLITRTIGKGIAQLIWRQYCSLT